MVSAPAPGQAHLAAVGVAGEHRVVPVGGVLVQDPEVRRVRDPEPEVGLGVGRSAHLLQPVVAEVRVVDAGERERRLPDRPATRGGW